MGIKWKKDGWTEVQKADAKKHVLEIMCRTENDSVVELRVRHNDGEEKKGEVYLNGEKALPLTISEFEKLFKAGKLDIK